MIDSLLELLRAYLHNRRGAVIQVRNDHRLMRVRAACPMSDDEQDQLAHEVARFCRTSPASDEEILDGVERLAQLGAPVEQLLTSVRTLVMFFDHHGVPPERAATILWETASIFEHTLDGIHHISHSYMMATTAYPLTADDLFSAVRRAGPVARCAGLTFSDFCHDVGRCYPLGDTEASHAAEKLREKYRLDIERDTR